MLSKDECQKAAAKFRAKYGIEGSDENLIAALHLMNRHGIDHSAALDQSSRSGNDHGVDAWFYHERQKELFVFQSKLAENKAFALSGLADLARAAKWLEQVIVDGQLDRAPIGNHCLFNLYVALSNFRKDLKTIHFVLISLFAESDLEDSVEYRDFQHEVGHSRLNDYIEQELGGKLVPHISEYDLEPRIPSLPKIYKVPRVPETRIELRKNAHLDLTYVPLQSLVELYRQRGDVLFDKNVRLSLKHTKEAKDRVVHPMFATLDLITSGKVSPSIFPFYHVGITIAASCDATDQTSALNLEAPSIINGCQTITIANEYLKGLERQNNQERLALFKKINVVAKIVIGASNDEVKEITNSNNRQNPIENWQLFSNEPIHIEIEAALKEIGIFYERQRGKFETIKNCDTAKFYKNTNNTFIKVVDLAQLIALSIGDLQSAAKPSEIFLNKAHHDSIFKRSVLQNPQDLVFVSNLFKALKRALNNYLEKPTYANSYAPLIFKKPMIRMHTYRLALMYFYKESHRRFNRADFSKTLTVIASPRLVDEAEKFYSQVIHRVRTWYTEKSKDLTAEVPTEKIEDFFLTLETALGIDTAEVKLPFAA